MPWSILSMLKPGLKKGINISYLFPFDESWKVDSEGDIYSTTINLSNDLTLKAGYDDNNISDSMDFIKLTYKFGGKDRPTISEVSHIILVNCYPFWMSVISPIDCYT